MSTCQCRLFNRSKEQPLESRDRGLSEVLSGQLKGVLTTKFLKVPLKSMGDIAHALHPDVGEKSGNFSSW